MRNLQITSSVSLVAMAIATLAIGSPAVAATISPINPAGDFFTNTSTQSDPQVDLTQPLTTAGWSYTNVRNGGTVGINNTYQHNGNATVELKGIYGPTSPSSKGDIEYTPAGGLGTLANLTALSYDWYRDSTSTNSAAQMPILRLYVVDPAHTATQGYIVFEPTYNDHPTDAGLTNTWVAENAFGMDAKMWSTGTLPASPAGPGALTLSQWIATYGSFEVLTLNAGFGSGWGSFSGAVDDLAIGFNGVTTAFTFATTPEPASLILMGMALIGMAVCTVQGRRVACRLMVGIFGRSLPGFGPKQNPAARVGLTVALIGVLVGSAARPVGAASITEGFENSAGSYNLATAGAGSASIVASPVHGGSQALDLSLTTSSDYARVKLDVSSSNLTLGQIASADYWVDRTAGDPSSQLPYLIFSINTPGSGGNDSTLAVMFNDPAAITPDVYTDLTVGPSTLFHVEGPDTTGLANPSAITLAALEASTYSPGVSWGSFAVDFVRIGYGMAGGDGVASNSFVDDLTIHTAVPVPEPSSLILASLAGIWLVRRQTARAR